MHVVGLWRYPVKSLQGEPLERAAVEAEGVGGDRLWGIRDEQTGRILTARRRPELLHARASYDGEVPVVALPDGGVAEGPGPDTDRLLSAWLDQPVSLVSSVAEAPGRAESFEDATDDSSLAVEWTMPERRYVDAAPLLVVTTASLRTGASLHPGGQWEPRRFRPNVLVEAPDDPEGDGWLEDGWVGQTLRLGTAELTVAQGCVRCTMVTREQPDGIEADKDMFRTLARHHGARFGVWCTVTTTGSVGLGDEISVHSVTHHRKAST